MLTRTKLLIYLVVFWLETAFTIWALTITYVEAQYTFFSGLLLGFFLAIIWILTIKWWNDHVFTELNKIIREANINN